MWKKLQVNTLLCWIHNSEPQITLGYDYDAKVPVIRNFDRKLCIDTIFHKYVLIHLICKLANSKGITDATWIEWIFMLDVLHENVEWDKDLMSLKFELVIENP